MMRSSGLSLTTNDIKSVADMVKIRGAKELSDGDAALLSKMTELIAETKPKMKTPKRFEMSPVPTISSLPRKPVVSSLPPQKPRLKVNLELKNRFRDRIPTRNNYLSATTVHPDPVEDVLVDDRYTYKIIEETEAEDTPLVTGFGMKEESADLMVAAPKKPTPKPSFPNFPKSVEKTSIRQLMRRPIRPTMEAFNPLPSTTTTEKNIEDSTRIRLEEFLMRNRPSLGMV